MEQTVFEHRPGWRPISRVLPKAPPAAYKTYTILSPIETHYRKATCKEVDCQHNLKGWTTKLDTNTVDGASTANWIRMHSGRSYRWEVHTGGIVTFFFPAGQKCFTPHKIPLGRPELFVVQGGDWRGNPMSLEDYKHRNGENWVDDFANHQDRLATVQQRG